jgi:predicted restriction endonuclease
VGWAIDPANRMNPHNGICLCALHDRAFDCGLLHVDETYRIFLADSVRRLAGKIPVDQNFVRFDGLELQLPERWLPNPVFLRRRLDLFTRAG